MPKDEKTKLGGLSEWEAMVLLVLSEHDAPIGRDDIENGAACPKRHTRDALLTLEASGMVRVIQEQGNRGRPLKLYAACPCATKPLKLWQIWWERYGPNKPQDLVTWSPKARKDDGARREERARKRKETVRDMRVLIVEITAKNRELDELADKLERLSWISD